MTKLELVLEKIRQLPQDRQDAIAADIEILLSDEEAAPLSDEQWAELQRRLADPNKTYVSHDELMAEFEAKYGR